MNKIILMGRLTKTPELNVLKGKEKDVKVCNTTLAVNRPGKDAGADFLPVKFWNGQAETVAKYCKKGDRVLVEGSLNQRTYDNKDGVKVYTYEVTVNNFEFIEKGAKEESASDTPTTPSTENETPTVEVSDDDLPF